MCYQIIYCSMLYPHNNANRRHNQPLFQSIVFDNDLLLPSDRWFSGNCLACAAAWGGNCSLGIGTGSAWEVDGLEVENGYKNSDL